MEETEKFEGTFKPLPQEEEALEDLSGDGKVTKRILRSGEGDKPKEGQFVKLHYTGKLITGVEFDSSVKRGQPFSFVLGEAKLIKGFHLAVSSMCVGESCVVTIHSDYGYGPTGDGNFIPPGATLQFEMELLSIEKAKKDKAHMTLEEKVQSASDEKESGNQYIKKGEIAEAIGHYKQAIEYLESVEEWPEAMVKSKDAVSLGCHLNLSNCYIKTKEFAESIKHSTKALEIDESNVKGLYRRGVASMNFGLLEGAKVDFIKAINLEPNNTDIRRDYASCRERLIEQNRRERQSYKGIFQKIDLYGDKNPTRDYSKLNKVFLDISVDDGAAKRLVITLYNDTVPKTAANFKALCAGDAILNTETKLHFRGCKFHRLIAGFMMQGGDITAGNGTGGESIYGKSFADEAFKDNHSKRGLLSMANAGPDTNSSQFFITFKECSHLDKKHVVFGEVTEGLQYLDEFERIETDEHDVPKKSVTIVDCGTL